MIKGEWDHLEKLAKDNLCSEHGTPVVVAKHQGENTFVLRCGEDHYPAALTRAHSLTEAHKAGTLGPHLANIDDLPKADLGSGELLGPDKVQGLIAYAKRYGLDAYRGHIQLMYGEPYITLDGYVYHAGQTKKPYKLHSRPLDDRERNSYQVPEGAHAWLCLLTFDEDKSSVMGLGIVTLNEMTEKSKRKPDQLRSPVTAKVPWLMAQKRSEWQALRRGFPIGEQENTLGGSNNDKR